MSYLNGNYNKIINTDKCPRKIINIINAVMKTKEKDRKKNITWNIPSASMFIACFLYVKESKNMVGVIENSRESNPRKC